MSDLNKKNVSILNTIAQLDSKLNEFDSESTPAQNSPSSIIFDRTISLDSPVHKIDFSNHSENELDLIGSELTRSTKSKSDQKRKRTDSYDSNESQLPDLRF